MEKSKAWDFALGIIKVDNLKVSKEFLELGNLDSLDIEVEGKKE